MQKILGSIAFIAASLTAQRAFAQVSYPYMGSAFTFFSCGGDSDCTTPGPNANTSYTASNLVTATLTFAAPLAANLDRQDVTTLAGFHLTMNDGQQTVTSSSAPQGGTIALVSTDASGNIIAPWAVFINTGGAANGGVATLNDSGGRGVADEGVLSCCVPDVPANNLAINFGMPGTWGPGSGLAPTPTYGTAARVVLQDQFPTDSTDITVGDLGKVQSVFVLYSTVGIQAAYPRISAITGANSAGLSAGAWSETATAEGGARGLAFRNFINITSGPLRVKVNAVLNGLFTMAPFGRPNGPAFAGAAIHVYDGTMFGSTVKASGQTAGQLLLGGYPAATELSPESAVNNLDSIFPGAVLANGAFYLANGPYGTNISDPVSTGLFTVAPQQTITIVFDVATATLPQTFGDQTGGDDVYFLDTLQPAPNFISDANGNPVSGIAAVDAPSPASLPPSPANLTLAPATSTNLVGAMNTVTATATDSTTAALPGAIVRFSVTGGPNVGLTGGAVTDANGHAAFSYTGTHGAGTDSIQANIGTLASNSVQGTWTLAPLPSGSACNGTYNGTFNGNVTVSKGQTCVLVGGRVTGNIKQNGGSLSMSNFTVGGNVQVQGGGTLSAGPYATIDGNLQIQDIPSGTAQSQVCRTTVKGNLQVQNDGSAVQIGSASPSCAGNVIGGNLQAQNNTASTAIFGNTVGGDLQDQDNTAPTQVFNNTVTNMLQCQSDASITGAGNTAKHKQGQCAPF